MSAPLRVASVLWSSLLLTGFAGAADAPPYTVTEQRETCANHQPLRQPFFGDLHVHTGFSQDASTQGTRATPADAYRFARGEPLGIQPFDENGKPLRSLRLERPLDFAAVTDHAEQIGEVRICNTPGMDGYWSWTCLLYRHLPRAAFFVMNTKASQPGGDRFGYCGEGGANCLAAARGPWQDTIAAAERFYDRSSTCEFTTFVGYEWTGAEDLANLHRNVIFRNDQVPTLPASFYEADTAEKLWARLDADCVDGCEYMVIPHNANLSDGLMFKDVMDNGSPFTAEYAARRVEREPLVEIMQHKGSSECYFRAGEGADELCAFEQLPYSRFTGKFFSFQRQPPKAEAGFVRETLVAGLAWERQLGVNPYKLGIIGSTDTHLGAAGAVAENDFPGHGGAGVPADQDVPKGLTDDVEFNPGGLAGVWAEENSRDALYAALRRRETFGTSGPRIPVRLFASADFSPQMCADPAFVEKGYAQGVPMGGDLKLSPTAKPMLAVAASYDPGTAANPGTPLQRIQIVKGWVGADGAHHNRVFDVAGSADNGAGVDVNTCERRGEGHKQLCAVWTDPEFDPSLPAVYYARVLENPSCRWSQRICVANRVDCSAPDRVPEELRACCAAEHQPSIQERAWSSPVWYTPEAAR